MKESGKIPSIVEIKSEQRAAWVLEDPLGKLGTVAMSYPTFDMDQGIMRSDARKVSLTTEGNLYFSLGPNKEAFTFVSAEQTIHIPQGIQAASFAIIPPIEGVNGQAYRLLSITRGFAGLFQHIDHHSETVPPPEYIYGKVDTRAAYFAQRAGFLTSDTPDENGEYTILAKTTDVRESIDEAKEYIKNNDAFLNRAAVGLYNVIQAETSDTRALQQAFGELQAAMKNIDKTDTTNRIMQNVTLAFFIFVSGFFLEDGVTSAVDQNYSRAAASAMVALLAGIGAYKANQVG